MGLDNMMMHSRHPESVFRDKDWGLYYSFLSQKVYFFKMIKQRD